MISNEERAAHEIRKLEQELENLEHAYATMGQGTRWMRVAFVVYIVVLLALVLWGVVIENGALAISSLAVLIIFVLSRFDDGPWIDYIPGSDAKVLENVIAAWKARLATLRGEWPGAGDGMAVGKTAGLVPRSSSNTGTHGHSGHGGGLRVSNGTFLIIVTTITVGVLSYLLVQKYNDCMERGGIACPLFCDRSGKNCRLPYGAPEPSK